MDDDERRLNQRIIRDNVDGTTTLRRRKVTDLPVEEFLSINGAGPEHSALRTLLTKLAQAG